VAFVLPNINQPGEGMVRLILAPPPLVSGTPPVSSFLEHIVPS
jgi:hypothetical protein